MQRVGRMAAWSRADGERGHSVARVVETADGWLCHGTEVLAGPHAPFSCTFAVGLDDRWRTRRVDVTAFSAAVRTLELVADGEGHWTRGGSSVPDLDGCLDVDIAATPLTNTFPIRRLGHLATGEGTTLAMAWVDVPSLLVSRVDQTYTRLDAHRWRYHDDTFGDFEVTVEDHGIVVDYTGLATRVWP